jgi:hypothetical protein
MTAARAPRGTRAVTSPAAARQRRGSVAALAALGILDLGQIRAALRFRQAWETVGGTGSASAGFAEKVDRTPDPAAPRLRRLSAAADLRASRSLLGAHGYMLVGRVCGDGAGIGELCRTRRQRQTAIDMLKTHLAELAALWH